MALGKEFKYQWFTSGDIGAAATIIFDNLTIITFISLILQFAYNFPSDIILNRIVPGTVVGIIVGNLMCFGLSIVLANKQKRQVTAIPFGLDAPSGIAFAVCIVGPAYNYLIHDGIDHTTAAIIAWHIGIGCSFVIACIKLGSSIFVRRLKMLLPQAVLLGAIAGVALALIGFFPLVSIFKTPLVGLASLSIVLITMFANVRLPFNISSIPFSIIFGTCLYYLLIHFGLSGAMPDLTTHFAFLLPIPGFTFLNDWSEILKYLPIVLPLALLVIFGSMSVVESAACLGENYKVNNIILIDSIATMAIALFGGISQTTPYAGFPAYKKLNARAGYLLINVLVIGIGGLAGIVSFMLHLLPESAIAPVLIFVAFEIIMQGIIVCEKHHVPAMLMAVFPSIARLVEIKLTDGSLMPVDKLQALCFKSGNISDVLAIIMLGNGFIVTGTLWGAMLCFAIDRRWWASFICTIMLSILSYYGVIHSVYITGQLYFPSSLPESVRHIPLELAVAYLLIGILTLAFSRSKHNKAQPVLDLH